MVSDFPFESPPPSLLLKLTRNCRTETWPKTLATLLPKSRPYIDSVIDSGGGNIANQVVKVIRDGGVIACYGQ
jgi:NADPH:quinone reductase-like Zn-dependent oxidoreductase